MAIVPRFRPPNLSQMYVHPALFSPFGGDFTRKSKWSLVLGKDWHGCGMAVEWHSPPLLAPPLASRNGELVSMALINTAVRSLDHQGVKEQSSPLWSSLFSETHSLPGPIPNCGSCGLMKLHSRALCCNGKVHSKSSEWERRTSERKIRSHSAACAGVADDAPKMQAPRNISRSISTPCFL